MIDQPSFTPLTDLPFFLDGLLAIDGHAPEGFSARVLLQSETHFEEIATFYGVDRPATTEDTGFVDPPVTEITTADWLPTDSEFLMLSKTALPGPL